MKYCEKSIRETTASNAEILKTIYSNMMKTRGRAEVEYRPHTDNPYMLNDIYLPGIDFTALFDSFEDGDFAFITYEWKGAFEKLMIQNLYKFSDVELYVDGVKTELRNAPNDSLDADVFVKDCGTNIIIKVIAKDGKFQAWFKDVMPEMRMSARNYIYNLNYYIKNDGFMHQKDVALSRLYKKGETVDVNFNSIEWIYPVKPEQSNEKDFDFNEFIGEGYTAYAYTEFEGKIKISHDAPIKIFVGGTEVYCAKCGVFEGDFKTPSQLLIKCRKGDSAWGFKSISDGKHSLSFVMCDDCDDLKWLWIGPFGKETEPISHPYPPELNLCFHTTFPSANGKKVYWNFYRKNTRMRQYLPTTFFGQWFYPMMVGMNGLRLLADRFEIDEIYDYYLAGMKLMAEHREYACFERTVTPYSDYLPGSVKLDHLDPIGTIGMNMAEYYLMTADNDAEKVLRVLAESIMTKIPRFEDGTYNRVKTMWTDDMYMSLPFLARLGVVMSDNKYFDEIVTQVKGFKKRMYMEDQNIFSHIYFPEEKVANRIPWGRGNGWVLLALSEVLLYMPEDYEGREYILSVFRDFAKGVLACRDKNEGIWHQVINNHESYVETSGSAMYITALARAIRLGWIDDSCKADVIEAWEALTEKCIDSCGNVYGVCKGSGCSMDEKYYIDLGTVVNDDHGIGIVLGAGVEIMNLLGE